MKQTAVEWLVTELKKTDMGKNLLEQTYNKTLMNQAKAMEKEQIMDANEDCSSNELGELLTGEQYYNETFKSE